jgi:hypothetical protein
VLSDLLIALDAIIGRDERPAGFAGRLCICVKDGASHAIWSVRLGDRPRGAFLSAVPADADAILVLGVEEADALMSGRALPAKPKVASVGGDKKLIERFFRRYFAITSWLDIRAGGKK